MIDTPSLLIAIPMVWLGLLAGAYSVAVLEQAALCRVDRRRWRGIWVRPVHRAAWLLRQETTITERPDLRAWIIATTSLVVLASAGAALIPPSDGVAVTDFRAGIVAWGAVEALVIAVVFLHGWSPNSVFPLVGGYRFVIQAFSYELLSMFVLIAAALPARSLQLTEIVRSQDELWNVIRQPLGLPLWIVVTLGVTFWGPLNLPDGRDLAGGTSAESSGRERLLWEVGRASLFIVFCAMGATIFLGGWLGPWLPGPVWVIAKTLLVAAVSIAVGQVVARFRPEGFVELAWTILLPLAFLNLFWAGVESLP